jgi:hypothetical protein
VSLRAVSWAIKQRAGRAKVVLVALAYVADDRGYCFPSLAYLVFVCEISESSVRRTIKELIARKLVAIEPRYSDNGACRSNAYRLPIGPPVKLTGYPATVTAAQVSNTAVGGCQGDIPTTCIPVMYEPPLRTGDAKAIDAPTTQGQRSGSDELCYPKAISDGQRYELEVLVRELPQHQAQQVLDELAGRMAIAAVRNPVGYVAELVRRATTGNFQRQLGMQIAERRAAEQQRRERLRDSRTAITSQAKESVARLPAELRASLEALRARAAARSHDDSSDDGSFE